MKITIIDTPDGQEDELILKCRSVDDNVMKLINLLKTGSIKLNVQKDGSIFLIDPKEIYYFESVDTKVFAYAKTSVYETKSKLYELEGLNFIRASKSVILNIDKIKSLAPAFGGRFEALLMNGEKVIISRQYVAILKQKLGL